MNKGKEIYSFTAEQIRYIKKIKESGRVNTAQGDQIQVIIRTQVNPRFNMCTSCPGTISKNFAKVVVWIEAFIGCDINDFNSEDCEGLLEEKNAEASEINDKTLEEQKAEAKAERKASEKAEEKRRADLKKKSDKAQKKATDKRKKERQALVDSRQQKVDDENERLVGERKTKAKKVLVVGDMCKEAIVVLLEGEHKLITERAELERVGSAKEILEHVEETTGVILDIDPKSKQQIINEALSTNRKIADYAKKNPELVDELEAAIAHKKQVEAEAAQKEADKKKPAAKEETPKAPEAKEETPKAPEAKEETPKAPEAKEEEKKPKTVKTAKK